MNHQPSVSLKKIIIPISLCILNLAIISGQDLLKDSLTVLRFGKVYTYKQSGIPANIIIMISGDGGWNMGMADFAKSFAEKNALVVGVDILRYYKDMIPRKEDCYMVASDFLELATAIEHKFAFTEYIPPVIMGYSSGATLVYGILAQARPGVIIGGISLGFCAEIDLPKRLCQTNGLSEKVITAGISYLLQPDVRLGNPWIVLQGKKDKICNFDSVALFVRKTADAELIVLPETGHEFSRTSEFIPQWKAAYNKLIAKYRTAQTQALATGRFVNFPISIVKENAPFPNAPIIIFFSGDGGWLGFENNISEKVGAYGIPTIGIDTKKYFWARKTPEKCASDMAEILDFYSKEWGKTQFIIMGYSQGAEVVPFIISRLPDQLKSKVSAAVMLSPETYTDFEIHITNMIGLGSRRNTYNVIEEIRKLQKINILSIYGDGERTPMPDLLKAASTKVVFIPGDHHYHANAALIVKTMKDNNIF
jgi:type IV secretory pathway VirJ component